MSTDTQQTSPAASSNPAPSPNPVPLPKPVNLAAVDKWLETHGPIFVRRFKFEPSTEAVEHLRELFDMSTRSVISDNPHWNDVDKQLRAFLVQKKP